VEWQIGYDAILGRIDKNGNEIKTPNKKALLKLEKTQLQNKKFIGSNGKLKCFYELSEYIQFFYDFKIISKNDLLNIKTYLQNTDKNNYLDNLKIKRTNFTNKNLNGIDYLYAEVEYPVLVYKFGKYEVYTEIIIQEQQYARGVQPMLFFCFPITELKTQSQLIGRVANRNEEAEFIINKDNIFVFLEMLKIFGNLSTNHNKDILSIINKII